jgi:hypothetical protein
MLNASDVASLNGSRPAVKKPTVTRAVKPMDDKAIYIGPVEKDVPVPPKPGREASEVCKAIFTLQVGESRRFANIDVKRLYGFTKRAKEKRLGKKYAVRAVVGGHRVWREE